MKANRQVIDNRTQRVDRFLILFFDATVKGDR
jgi:hypothetical protein